MTISAQIIQLASTQRPMRDDILDTFGLGDRIPGTYLFPRAVERFLQDNPIGRLLVTDPAGRFLLAYEYGFPVELNLYTYCRNSPIIIIDPYGLWSWGGFWKSVGIGAGVGAVWGATAGAIANMGNPFMALSVPASALLGATVGGVIGGVTYAIAHWDDEGKKGSDGTNGGG